MDCTDATLTLRALEPGDVDRIYLWENSPAMWRYGYSQAPLSRHQIWEYIRNYDANPLSAGELRLLVCEGLTAVGAVDLYDVDVLNRRAMAGIMIDSAFRGRGYGLQALKLLENYSRDNLGLHQLGAMVADDNAASQRLFLRAGFTETARLPQWFRNGTSFLDAVMYQKILG